MNEDDDLVLARAALNRAITHALRHSRDLSGRDRHSPGSTVDLARQIERLLDAKIAQALRR